MRKRHVAVILTYKGIVEALTDVALAHSRSLTDVSNETKVLVSDIVEEGNEGEMERLINKAVERVRQALGGYELERVPGTTADDSKIQPGDRVIFRMTVADSYGRSAGHLATFCNEYVVNKVMEDWTRIVCPKSVDQFAGAAEDCMTNIRRALNRRVGGARIKMDPF